MIDVASNFDLCIGWHIVAANEEESRVDKDKFPDRNLRHWGTHGIGCDGTGLRQHFGIALDVRSESDLHNVIDSIGSQSPNSFRQVSTSEQNFVCSCSCCAFLVT